MPHPVIEAAERFRRDALNRERAAASQLVRAYGRIYQQIDPAIIALEQKIAMHGFDMADAARLADLPVIREMVREQVNRYAIFADQLVAQEVTANIQAGLSDSSAMVEAHFDSEWLRTQGYRLNANVISGLRASWTRLPVEAVETLTGMTAQGSPLRAALVNRLGDAVAEQMADALVAGIALGRNPRIIARQVLGGGLQWSLTTARTAQLYAYREATRANYRANRDIVSGWRWMATFDRRTCVSCLAQHGSVHDVDEVLNDHHNGRCLVPGQTVTTRRGLVAIEAVQVGDFVLTHNGRWRAVTATSQRPFSGNVYQFAQGGLTLTVTPEHPMLTQRGWIAAKDCKASDTLLTLKDIEVRASSRKTVHPRAANAVSLAASRADRFLVLCQPGSYSTASIAAGYAKSILNEPTACCGSGVNPAPHNDPYNLNSSRVQYVRQFSSRHLARAIARRRWGSGASILETASGFRSIWRNAASLDDIGSIPDSRIQRISVRVLTSNSAHSSRYEALSAMYRRRNQSAIGSPSRAAMPASKWPVLSAPASEGERRNPSDASLCCTALGVRPESNAAISAGNIEPNDSRMMESSASVQTLPAMRPPFGYGYIIHHPLAIWQIGYDGMVYNLQVAEDESYIANGIVVHNCVAIPIVPLAERLGIPAVDVGDSEAWFRSQPEAAQRAQMGPGMWDEWKAGTFGFRDLTTTYDDPVYGEMRRAPTLAAMKDTSGVPA